MPQPHQSFVAIPVLLKERGYKVDKALYEEEGFGGWVVVVQTTPQGRIAWEGRHGWLALQRANPTTLGGPGAWDDI